MYVYQLAIEIVTEYWRRPIHSTISNFTVLTTVSTFTVPTSTVLTYTALTYVVG